MTRTLILLAACILLPRSAACEAPSANPIELINWMVLYYQAPDPDRFLEKVMAFSETGLLTEEKRQFTFLGFASTVFRDNPDRVEAWVRGMEKLPREHLKVVLLALWLSDTEQSKIVIRESKHRELLAGKNYFNFLTNESPPRLDSIDPLYIGFLDLQWGRFLASGSKVPIRLIVGTLELGDSRGPATGPDKTLSKKDKRKIIEEAILRAALRSLRSNCRRHPLVRQHCLEISREGRLSPKASQRLSAILLETEPKK